MAAFFETGFSVREPSWHGLAKVLSDYPVDWDDARKKAGLLWEPTYADLFVEQVYDGPFVCAGCSEALSADHHVDCSLLDQGHVAVQFDQCKDVLGGEVPKGSVPVKFMGDLKVLAHVPADGHQAIIRDDTRAVLATPTDSYKLILHSQMGELLDAYTEAWRKNGAAVKFETAGSLRGGAMVWALVWLDEPFKVKGDSSETLPFAALLNAHDGSAACKLIPTSVRVICWNTWKMAEMESDRMGSGITLRHAGNVTDRLEDAKASLSGLRNEAKEWEMLANDLASINVTDAVFRSFLEDFIPIPEGATDRTRNDRLSRQSTFSKLYFESPTTDGIRGTAYGVVQAAGEYLDHLRPFRSADTYMSRTMLTNETTKGGVARRVRELINA